MAPIEVAVAGCGPAGLATALLLARDGHRVTLFERFGEARPVGSGLMIQPTGLAVLRALGLAQALEERSARVDRLFGLAGGRVVLDVRYRALGIDPCYGLGVHRATLFHVLHEAVLAQGIAVETGREVTGSEAAPGGRRLLLFADGRAAGPFDLVADALGTHSPLPPPGGRDLLYGALWANLRPVPGFAGDALEQRYQRASRMAGVLPVGTPPGAETPRTAFFWSIRCDAMEDWRRRGLDAWKADVLALWPETGPLLDQIGDASALTPARYRHRTLARAVSAPGLIHLGDAWHSASPQLGQGANMALLDAWALAAGLRTAPDVAAALTAAAAMRRRHVRLYQAITALFTPVYQSDSRVLPLLRDLLVGPLSRIWPATRVQAAMVAGLVGSPLGRLGLR